MGPGQLKPRQTKYCFDIIKIIAKLQHATNAEILRAMRQNYPKLSATTVHRATARLADRGKIAIAPSASDGSIRYDANLKPHDHFLCSRCGKLKDGDVKYRLIDTLRNSFADCEIAGRITICGLCRTCAVGGRIYENNYL